MKRGQAALLYTILILLIMVFFLLVISVVLQIIFPQELSPETLVFEGISSTDSNLAITHVQTTQDSLLVTLYNAGSSTIYGVTIAFVNEGKTLNKQFALPEYLYKNTTSTIKISNTVENGALVYDEVHITPHYAKVIATTLDLVGGSFFDTSIAITQETGTRSGGGSGGGGGSSNAKNNNNGNNTNVSEVTLPEGTLLFVATNGDDSNDGSQDFPLRTLDAAKQKVRAIKAQGLTDDLFVIVREGTYYRETPFELTVEDSGTKDYEITYMAYPGEEVIISGAKIVQPTWSAYDENIYVADLSGQDMFYSLYVNGERATRARTANGGFNYMLRYADESTKYTTYFDYNTSEDIPSSFNFEGVEVISYVGFLQMRFLLDRVEGNRIFIDGDNYVGFNYRNDYGRFYLENSLSFLDFPGEWYFDNNTKKLYYYPRDGEEIVNSEFQIPIIERLLYVHGNEIDLHLSPSFSFATWVKTTSNEPIQVVLDSKIKNSSGFRLELRNDGKPFFNFASSKYNNKYFFCDESPALNDSVWHHIVAIVDREENNISCFVDGDYVQSWNVSKNNITGLESMAPYIGGSYAQFEGNIDELVMFNVSLTHEQVLSLYLHNNRSGLANFIVFDVPFDNSFDDDSTNDVSLQYETIQSIDNIVRYNNPTFSSGKFGSSAYFDGFYDEIRPYDVGKRVHDITIKDFIFEKSDWSTLPFGHVMYVAGYNNEEGSALLFDRAEYITFQGNEVRDVGWQSILGLNSQFLSIIGNEIHDVDSNGIVIYGMKGVAENIFSGHVITDNIIYNTGQRDQMNGMGIFVQYSGNNVISHNLIYDLPARGIRVFSDLHSFYTLTKNNTVSYNKVHDVNLFMNDGGGIYFNGLQPGTTVHHNIVHDVVPTENHVPGHLGGFHGIYLDQGASEISVSDNLVYRTQGGSIFLHIANNNNITNNIFVDSNTSTLLYLIRRPVDYRDGSSQIFAVNNSFERNIFYSGNGKPTAYIGFSSVCTWDSIGSVFAFNDYNLYSDDNFIYGLDNQNACGGTGLNSNSVNLQWYRDNFNIDDHSLVADPLFVDYANDDFRLQSNSPAFALGFEEFDLSTVGPRL